MLYNGIIMEDIVFGDYLTHLSMHGLKKSLDFPGHIVIESINKFVMGFL